MSTDDPFALSRFVSAQEPVFDTVVQELAAGQKRSHWMWFVFPQIAGLGLSPMAVRYAISGLAEARAYVAHPVLGQRLRQCCGVLVALPTADPVAVFGGIDAVKLRSSMTLFAAADPVEPAFAAVLDRFFDGERDPATLARL